MMFYKSTCFVIILVLLMACSIGVYADMFSVSITVGPQGNQTHHSFSFNSIQQAIDTFSDEFIQDNFGQYNPETDQASGTVNFRGLQATFSYNSQQLLANSIGVDTLDIDIPSIGVHEVFHGASRDVLDQEVKDWFKGQGDTVIKKVYQGMVSQTATDPIAGNPTSLMGDMISQAFNAGNDFSGKAQQSYNIFSINSTYQNAEVSSLNGDPASGNHVIQSVTVPLYYAHAFSSGNQILMIDLPVTQFHYDNSTSYSGQFDMALRNRINQYWDLTPEASVAGSGSIDMGSISLVYAGFVKSKLTYPYHHWFFSLRDMAGYMQTQGIKVSGYDIDYGLRNWVLENGITTGYKWPSYLIDIGYSHTNTFGSAWYFNNYNTISMDVAMTKKVFGLEFRQLSLDMSYTFAKSDYQMLSLGLNYQF